MKIIYQGAEAVLKLDEDRLIKERVKKKYRIKEIDNFRRKYCTRREAKLLKLAFEKNINVPKVVDVNENGKTIIMEYLGENVLRDVLDELDEKKIKEIFKKIGRLIGKLHNLDIVHGDITTSNLILKNNEIYIIDFGLGFISNKIEDKAVDLHLLSQALDSKHYGISEFCFEIMLNSYGCDMKKEILERLKKVEKRGRYKGKND